MNKILVIGATSLIAQHCIKIWNSRGDKLFLVGRNVISMKKILKVLKKKREKKNFFFLDVNRIDLHKEMLNKAEKFLGNIDLAFISYGTLPNQKKCQTSTNLTLKEIKTNALSTISILTSLANKLEMKRRGTIAVISSLAGDRGRASNYVYGCSKAMITTFLSGLGQRLKKSNVNVITIKPGFVHTPMTKSLKKNLLYERPSEVAKIIVKGIDNNKYEIYAPSFWRLIIYIVKFLPESIFRRLNF